MKWKRSYLIFAQQGHTCTLWVARSTRVPIWSNWENLRPWACQWSAEGRGAMNAWWRRRRAKQRIEMKCSTNRVIWLRACHSLKADVISSFRSVPYRQKDQMETELAVFEGKSDDDVSLYARGNVDIGAPRSLIIWASCFALHRCFSNSDALKDYLRPHFPFLRYNTVAHGYARGFIHWCWCKCCGWNVTPSTTSILPP